MPEILGRLRTPRLAGAPSAPQTGELYYDTNTNVLYWWNGTGWITATGTASATVYEQAAEPLGAVVGDIWIETDAPVPVAGRGMTYRELAGGAQP